MSFKLLLLVGCGGFLGAILRFLISAFCFKFMPLNFPYATLIVNVLGGFLIGYFTKIGLNLELKSFLIAGFLGALTTFSTFSVENINLLQNAKYGLCFLNVSLSLVLCFLACYLALKFS